jgi:N-acetylglucosaminyldiphosphoundecaprenol N-acetyl-beta-D-mannosaminyltransferase
MNPSFEVSDIAWSSGVERNWRSVQIGPLEVDDLSQPELLDVITRSVTLQRGLRFFYANAHAVRLAAEDRTVRNEIAKGDIVFCDGRGIRLASRFLGTPLRASMTPPDWIDDLFVKLAESARVYLVGDKPDIVAAAAAELRLRHPRCAILGMQHGYFAFPGSENDRILAEIRAGAPTLVLVGMGMPRQEQWINLVAPHLPTASFIAVGALFRRLSGHDPRPPHWMQKVGLEWLYRLIREPVRLFDRYVVGLPKFGSIILWQRIGDRRVV